MILGVTFSPVAESACTVNPTLIVGTGIANLVLAANTPYTFDLKGFIATSKITGSSFTPTGIEVLTQAALTGTASVTFFWYEKQP